jgi:hypothetical protein
MAKKKGLARSFPLMLGAAVVIGAVAVGVTGYQKRAQALAAGAEAAKLAQIDGPPCQTLTGEEYVARGSKANKTFVFDEIRFDRRYGHVDCNSVSTGQGLGYVPVCQFSGPSLLVVTTPKGSFYFAPGAGKPTTVITEDGTPRCIVDGNFRPELS